MGVRLGCNDDYPMTTSELVSPLPTVQKSGVHSIGVGNASHGHAGQLKCCNRLCLEVLCVGAMAAYAKPTIGL